MKYDQFRFLYPPRPESKVMRSAIQVYDTEDFIAQVKYNGSCCNVFLDGTQSFVFNRHYEPKTRVPDIDFNKAYNGSGWMAFSGELMDKSKRGEDGEILPGFIIWDILVHNGEYLLGTSLYDRLNLLEKLYGCSRKMYVSKAGNLVEMKHLCDTGIQGIYKAPSYMGGRRYFTELYDEVIKTDAYEGLVIKKINSVLEPGYQSANNIGWQIKVRKPTKNYKS